MQLKTTFLPPLMVLFLLMFAGTRALAQDIEINEENFPDENFRNWLFLYPEASDSVLTEDEIASFTSITVNNKNIRSLKGIEFFTSLRSLSCTDNLLTELDVSGLANLESLICFNNQLTELDVSHSMKLKSLNCQNNQLKTLDVRFCLKLESLKCAYNQLEEFRSAGLLKLMYLYCNNNQLKSMELGSCRNLYWVDCYMNQIRGEEMTKLLKSLQYIEDRPLFRPELRVFYTTNPRLDGNRIVYSQVHSNYTDASYWKILDDQEKFYHGLNETDEVSIGNIGYTTWVTDLLHSGAGIVTRNGVDFSLSDDVTAYVVTAATATGIKLVPVKAAGLDHVVILNAPEGKYAFTELVYNTSNFRGVDGSSIMSRENLLKASDGTVTGDGRTIYKLDSRDQGVGFYLVPSGEAVEHYLVIESTADDAPEFIPMGTDIEIPEEEVTPAVPPVQIGDLWYDLDSDTKMATVAAVPDGEASYSGTVVIPKTVSSDGDTYRVTAIGDKAFYFCRSLESVTIGSNVASIGTAAFAMSTNLKQIICLATTPPECGLDAFYSAGYNNSWSGMGSVSDDRNCPLYVPKGSVSEYKAANRWKDFFRMKSELSVTIGSTGYATYCGMTDLDFTGVENDVKAYVASSYDDGSVTLVPVTNVPAGTGLLLIGTAGTYDVPFVVTENAYDDNLLVGTLEAQPLPRTEEGYTNYVLGRKDTEVAFFLPKEDETIAAYKAYLRLPTDVPSAVRMVIADGTTAVDLPPRQEAGQQQSAVVYNLTGQRVSTPQRGLYIVGGKKVIVK